MIVHENAPRWARLLRPLADGDLQECRNLSQLRQAVATSRGGLVAAELQIANAVACLRVLSALKRQFSVGVIGLVDRRLKPHAALLYEFGCDVLVYSPLDLVLVERMLVRASLASRDAPDGPQTPREQVWARMPWKRCATGGSQSASK